MVKFSIKVDILYRFCLIFRFSKLNRSRIHFVKVFEVTGSHKKFHPIKDFIEKKYFGHSDPLHIACEIF